MLVMKFGGTSVECAESIARVGRIVSARLHRRPVVVVTNDREVVDAVRRVGGEALPSAALLGRLERS